VRVIGLTRIARIAALNSRVSNLVDAWYSIAKHSTWRDFRSVRQSFPQAESQNATTIIFPLGSASCRITTLVEFATGTLLVCEIEIAE